MKAPGGGSDRGSSRRSLFEYWCGDDELLSFLRPEAAESRRVAEYAYNFFENLEDSKRNATSADDDDLPPQVVRGVETANA